MSTPTRETAYQILNRFDLNWPELLDAIDKALRDERETHSEVVQIAQGMLTALNVGDVQSESALHLKLREVMIAYRAAIRSAATKGSETDASTGK